MTTLNLRLAQSLHRMVGEIAQREGISVEQFISTAVAEKVAALVTEEYLGERAKRASVAEALAILDRIPDVDPDPGDELPADRAP
jgi:hypothetical protein